MPSSTQTKTDSLNGVVVKSKAINVQLTEEGLVRICYPVPVPRLLARLLPAPGNFGTRNLELDTMGTFVWQQIDDRRTVHQLAELITDRYQCQPHEAELALAQFIRQLGRKNIVGVR